MAAVDQTAVIEAALSGARSLRWRGWEHEELESAALEHITRRPPGSTLEAFQAGRTAALDELRRLTCHRVRRRNTKVQWPEGIEHVIGAPDPALDEVEDRAWVGSLCSGRFALMLDMAARGAQNQEIATELGVHPSRVTQLWAQLRKHVTVTGAFTKGS